VGELLANAAFHFQPSHPFISMCLQAFPLNFDAQERLSGGPQLWTRVFNEFCSQSQGLVAVGHYSECNMTVLPQKSFYPVGAFDFSALYNGVSKTEKAWEEFFSESYGVHFYASSIKSKALFKQRKFYGKEVPAMFYLAENYCPSAKNAEKGF